MIDKQTPHQIGDIVYYALGNTGAVEETKIAVINYKIVPLEGQLTAVAISYTLSNGRCVGPHKLHITLEELLEKETLT